MKRVLITGATGFLGSITARRMAEAGYAVLATGRNRRAGERLEKAGIKFRAADLSSGADLRALCDGATAVIHSAALSSPWGSRDAFESANVLATKRILKAAQEAGVERFVHISTPAIYFSFQDRFMVRESDPLPRRAVNHYADTKLQAERVVQGQSLPYIILRPRAIYGPEDSTVFPRLLRALQRGKLPVIGSGDNICDLSYVDNVSDAIVAAVEAGDHACGHPYNITDGEPIRLWAIIRRLAEALELPPPRGKVPTWAALGLATLMEQAYQLGLFHGEPMLTRYGVGVLSSSMTLDISRAREALGYTPTVGVDEGIRRFVQWHRENHP